MADAAGDLMDEGGEPVCPGCGAPVDRDGVQPQGRVERVGCRRCGLQLVRRPGQPWSSIRG